MWVLNVNYYLKGAILYTDDGGEEEEEDEEQNFDECEENTHSSSSPCESKCSKYEQKKISGDCNESIESFIPSDYEDAGDSNNLMKEKRSKKLKKDISVCSVPKPVESQEQNSNLAKMNQNETSVAISELTVETSSNTSNSFQEKSVCQSDKNAEPENVSPNSGRSNLAYFKKSLASIKSESKKENINNMNSNFISLDDHISILKDQKVNQILNEEFSKEKNSNPPKDNTFDLQSLLRIYDVPLKSFNFSVNRKLLNSNSNEPKFDQNYHLILSVLSDKIYQLYMEDIQSLTKQRERALKLIFQGVKKFEGYAATKTDIWDGLLESIPQIVRSLTLFARQIPGLNEIGQKDFYTIINNKVFNYFILRNSQLLIYGESYMLLPNNIQYTRDWMLRIIGKEMTDALFRFCEEFNMLGLRGKEFALLYPFVLTSLIEGNK